MKKKTRYRLLKEVEMSELIKELVTKLGKRFLDQETLYTAVDKDVKIMFDCINKFIFNGKLEDIEIELRKKGPQDDCKGSFLYSSDGKNKKIVIISDPTDDIMLNISDVLAHEMIHYYDYCFGPLSKIVNKNVVRIDGKQFIGDYDVHGSYFMSFVEILADNLLPVSIKHYYNMRYFMEDFTEEENEKLTHHEKVVRGAKALFDSIKTDGVFLVEVDKNDKVWVVMS